MSAYLTRIAQFTEVLLLNRSVPSVAVSPETTEASEDVSELASAKLSMAANKIDCLAYTVDFERLRRMSYEGGVPDIPGFRSLCWKLLLNFLPSEKVLWQETLERKRRAYKEFVVDLWPPPGSDVSCMTDSGFQDPITETSMPGYDVAHDKELIISIERDVQRTSSSMGFYRLEVPEEIFVQNTLPPPKWICPSLSNKTSRAASPTSDDGKYKVPDIQLDGEDPINQPLRHYDVIRRILYIYAKLNPGIGYIQGMNHLVFPIYYVLATGGSFNSKKFAENTLNDQSMPIDDNILFAESDTFYLLHEVLTEYRDFFMNSMDNNKSTGINSALESLAVRLNELDKPLASDLIDKGIAPTFYAFRWFTCLCAKDLELPDILRLWDTLFADRIAARKRGRRELLKREQDERLNAVKGISEVADKKVENIPVVANRPRHIRRYSLSSILHDIANSGPAPVDVDPAPRPGLFLTDFLATVVISRRPEIFKHPFDESLEILQQHPWSLPVDELIKKTHQLHTSVAPPKVANRFSTGILSAWGSRGIAVSSPRSSQSNPKNADVNENDPSFSPTFAAGHTRTRSDGSETSAKSQEFDFFSKFRMKAFSKVVDTQLPNESGVSSNPTPQSRGIPATKIVESMLSEQKNLDSSIWQKISSSIASRNT